MDVKREIPQKVDVNHLEIFDEIILLYSAHAQEIKQASTFCPW